MRIDAPFLLASLLVGGLGVTVSHAADKPDAFLDDKGWLKGDLVLRDAQEGFVGVSGEIVTIEKCGRWTRARFVNKKVEEPHRKGQLTKDTIKKLAETLAEDRFLTLPASFGREVPVNRHFYELRFDRKSAQLILAPGESIKDVKPADPDAKKWKRFLHLIRTIEELAKEPKRPTP